MKCSFHSNLSQVEPNAIKFPEFYSTFADVFAIVKGIQNRNENENDYAMELLKGCKAHSDTSCKEVKIEWPFF